MNRQWILRFYLLQRNEDRLDCWFDTIVSDTVPHRPESHYLLSPPLCPLQVLLSDLQFLWHQV